MRTMLVCVRIPKHQSLPLTCQFEQHLSPRPPCGDAMQRSGHVAIVVDDTPTRLALGRLLLQHGIDSRSYPSARAFLAALSSAMPNCLIVDVNMPDMTGLNLKHELLDLDIHIPTIVTGIDDAEVAEGATSLGATAFLPKPLTEDTLMVAITLAVKKW